MKQSIQLSLAIVDGGVSALLASLPRQNVMVTSRVMRTAALYLHLYSSLLDAALHEISLTDPEFSARWDSAIQEYGKLDAIYCYIERLLYRRAELRQTLNDMQQSRLWKLIAPLRWIDDKLRAQRKRKHLQRRAVTS